MAQVGGISRVPGSKVHGTKDVVIDQGVVWTVQDSEGSNDPEVVEFWSTMVRCGIEACTVVLDKDGTGESWYCYFDETVYYHTGPQTHNPYWKLCKEDGFLSEIGNQLQGRLVVTFS